nr:hypothetical protein [Rathayibacter tanaceti]
MKGPEPTTAPRQRSSGVLSYEEAARIARFVVEVPCRNAALGVAKATFTVSASTTSVPE